MKNVLITGAFGQIGTELMEALLVEKGVSRIVALDVKRGELDPKIIFEKADVANLVALDKIIAKHKIDTIFHLASLLSVASEADPQLAWRVNMLGLKNILDLSLKYKARLFWPSSIAAFGPTTPKVQTPQTTVLEPLTIYGAIKVSGELLCRYYNHKYGLDVRSVRFPGLISWKQHPGGGTTGFAVAMFHGAIGDGRYECYLKKDTALPLMYMSDAVRAILDLMKAPKAKIKLGVSYNIAALSLRPGDLEKEISKYLPLEVTYKPDYRQQIADSWPKSLNDTVARRDWGWKARYDLPKLTADMLKNLQNAKRLR